MKMRRQESENRQESKAVEPRQRGPFLQDNWLTLSPFGMMRRFTDEMDRLFEGFGQGRMERGQFLPNVDIFQRDGKLVVRADLPGMSKENVNVEITADAIVINGERKYEHEANEEGMYRCERSYGHFHREIPLPEGVKTENATAKFKDGVLEVTVDAPAEKSKNSRRIEIQEGEAGPKPGKSAA
jgi:HSP20 family protein